MGNLIWHQWARLLALASATYMLWASLWAFFYRKFFWDFVGGELGPTGLIPNGIAKGFNKIIIGFPILQTITLVLSIATIALEYPLPQVKGTIIYRSHVARIAMYLSAALSGLLVYQTFDCALYYVITSMAYARSMLLKETIGDEGKKTRSEA